MFTNFFGLLFLIAWLQPFHSLPWSSALNDGLALTGGLVAVVYLAQRGGRSKLDISFVEFAVLVLVVLHLLWSTLMLENRSVLPHVLTVSTAWLLYRLEKQQQRLLPVLLLSVLLASSLTALVGLLWFFGSSVLDNMQQWLVEFPPGGRWGGNLNQPNNTGTLLIWGMIAAQWWCRPVADGMPGQSRRAGFWLVLPLTILLGLASALVQSRTATLNLLLLGVAALLLHHRLGSRMRLLLALGLLSHLAGLLGLPLLQSADSLSVHGGRGLSSSLRLEVWRDFLTAAIERPWLGWGVGGTSAAFVEHADPAVGYGMYFAHTHNLFIDLLIWFGLPLGGLLIVLIVMQLLRAVSHFDADNAVPLALCMTLFVHALLEFPHNYAYFLVPVAIAWANVKTQQSVGRPLFSVPAWSLGAVAALVLTPLFFFLANDYLDQEAQLRHAKLEWAIKGYASPPTPAPYGLLPDLEDLNYFARRKPENPLTPDESDRLQRVLSMYPSRSILSVSITMFENSGLTSRAKYWKERACAVYRGEFCTNRPDLGSE